MRRRVTIGSLAVAIIVAVFISGLLVGQRTAFMTRYGWVPCVDYVIAVERDSSAIRDLREGKTEDVLRRLNQNLNQQIYGVDWVYRESPSLWMRRFAPQEKAFNLLVDIAEHRSAYDLSPTNSKEGEQVHAMLDAALKDKRARQDR